MGRKLIILVALVVLAGVISITVPGKPQRKALAIQSVTGAKSTVCCYAGCGVPVPFPACLGDNKRR